ncbi:hypothetical protein ACJW30_03G056900 [Castanea mollissima]
MSSTTTTKTNVVLPPRKINLQKFRESRGPELESLHSLVSTRLNNDFRSRRNKRRRTTSYDNQAAKKSKKRRRRNETSACLEKDRDEKEVKVVPRRIRRRIELRMNQEKGFSSSGDGTKRLRTHVWYAKRFAMTKLWGFYLPLGLQGRGRGSRALLKWFKQEVLVHDASYHISVQLEGPEESLISVLKSLMVPSPSDLSETSSRSVISGAMYGSAMLHHVGAPLSQPIAPVTYMWRPVCQQNRDSDAMDHDDDGCDKPGNIESSSSFRQMWVWIHVSAFSEGFDALKFTCQKEMDERGILINCVSLEGQLAKLEVLGLKAFEHLQKILHPVTCSSENPWQLRKHSAVESKHDSQLKSSVLENQENFSSHAIVSLRVKDPRIMPEKRFADVPESLSTGMLSISDAEAKEDVALAGILNKHEELLSGTKPGGNSIIYDNKDLWDSSSGVSPPVEDIVLCMEKNNLRMDKFCLDASNSGMPNTSTKVQCSRSCPILLLKNNDQKGLRIGWSIILPLSWVRVFWAPLTFKGAHAIGLREKHWVASEMGMPFFPSDFPDCNAYSFFMANEAAVSNQKVERSPPDVRPWRVPIPPPWETIRHAFKEGPTRLPDKKTSILKLLKDESKFGPSLNGIAHFGYGRKLCFLRILLHAYKEGVFEEGAVVCAPQLTDISLLISRSGTDKGGLQMPQSAVRSYFKEQSPAKWELHKPEDAIARESHRWPIGFVTTGFVRGSKKPVAEALCEAVLLARLREEQCSNMPKKRRKEIYVLVRNLRSSSYRLALATIVLEQQEEDVEFL